MQCACLLAACCRKIEKHLKKHAQWLAHRDGTAEAPVTRELLDQVCKGAFGHQW